MVNNLMTNDFFIERLAKYYTFHEVGKKFYFTFSDFLECVKSGRWQEFMEDKKKPLNYDELTKETKYWKISLFIDEQQGYSMSLTNIRTQKQSILHYGISYKAREQALVEFNDY